jgi:hypothetical protein
MKITIEFDTDVEGYDNKEMLRAIHATDLALTVWQYQTYVIKELNNLGFDDKTIDIVCQLLEQYNELKLDINELID